MKTDFFELPDFNRMLVVSVFVHLLFLTLVMFLPKPALHPKVVVPAFMVNLIELPSSKTNRPSGGDILPRKKVKAVKPPRQPPAVKQEIPPPVAKKTAAVKALIHKLDQLNGETGKAPEPAASPLLQELDKLAQLAPPAAKKTAVKKKKRTASKVLRELRSLKNKKALLPPPKPRKLEKPAVVEETLDELKRQSEVLKQNKIQAHKPELPQTIVSKNLLPELEKMKSAERATAGRQQKTGKRSVAELLAELEAMPDVAARPKPAPKLPPGSKPPPDLAKDQEKAFQQILEKLAALEQPGKSMEIQIDKPQVENFTSAIHERQPPRKAQAPAPEGTPGQTPQAEKDSAAPANDRIAADVLSLYVGIIQKMVFAHWKSPLGAEYNDIVEVSFYLYPKGNIDKPAFIKRSGEEQLNTLAVRAIYDSEPFPKFPPDLKASNLHIKIKFKYRPAND